MIDVSLTLIGNIDYGARVYVDLLCGSRSPQAQFLKCCSNLYAL